MNKYCLFFSEDGRQKPATKNTFRRDAFSARDIARGIFPSESLLTSLLFPSRSLSRQSRHATCTRVRNRIPKRIHHGDFDACINPEGRPEREHCEACQTLLSRAFFRNAISPRHAFPVSAMHLPRPLLLRSPHWHF